MINKIRASVDELLLALNKQFGEEIKTATKVYEGPFEGLNFDLDIDYGFNNWIIHDYKTKKGYLVDLVDMDEEIKNAIKGSVLSIFKVNLERNNIVFKDLITGEDYIIETEQLFNDGDIVKVRVYPKNHKYLIIDNPHFYSPTLESTIRKSVMSKYNEFCSKNEPIDIRDFIKNQAQLIYQLANIIDFYEAEMEDDESLYVYTVKYGIKDKEEALDLLLETEVFQITDQYEDETTLIVLDEGVQVAEVLVLPSFIEVEATNESLRKIAMDLIEGVLKEHAVKLSEEVLGIDDIL